VQQLFGLEDKRMFIYSEMMWTGKKVLKAYLKVHGILQTGHTASPVFLQRMCYMHFHLSSIFH